MWSFKNVDTGKVLSCKRRVFNCYSSRFERCIIVSTAFAVVEGYLLPERSVYEVTWLEVLSIRLARILCFPML